MIVARKKSFVMCMFLCMEAWLESAWLVFAGKNRPGVKSFFWE